MYTYLEIIELTTGETIKRSDLSKMSESQQNKCEMGYINRTNLDRFCVGLYHTEDIRPII